MCVTNKVLNKKTNTFVVYLFFLNMRKYTMSCVTLQLLIIKYILFSNNNVF